MSNRLAKGTFIALIAAVLIIATSFGVLHRRAAPPVPDSDTLDYVKHLVWLNNWADAAERLARMESRSALPTDSKTAVFCSTVRLRGRVESGRLHDVAEQLRALLATPEATDPDLRLLVLSALGDVLFQYNLQEAESVWVEAGQLAAERNDSIWEARSAGELGTIAFLNGDVLRALRLVSSAALRAETNGDVASQIRYSTALGEGLGKFGRKPDAMKFFDRALRLYDANPGAYFPFTAFVGKARLLAEAGKTADAEEMLRRELANAHERGHRGREARILITLGDLLAERGRFKEAYEQLKHAADLASAAGMYRIESDVTTKLADVSLRVEGVWGALPYAERSVEAAERAGDSYSLPQKLAVLAEIQAASGHTSDADRSYANASKLIDNLLQTVPYSKDKSTLIGAMGRVFVGHFELAVLKLNGVAAFLLFAARSLGTLKHSGMDHACWEPAPRATWIIAVASGIVMGLAVVAIASLAGQAMTLSGKWNLIVLQFTLGPVLEEIIFRGYLFGLLQWSLRWAFKRDPPSWMVILTAAGLFSLVHLAQSGVGHLQLACVAGTGTLYGWLRYQSGSTAPAAASHAAYNLALCVAAAAMARRSVLVVFIDKQHLC